MIAFHRLIIVVLLLVTAASANAQNFEPFPRVDPELNAQQLKILRGVDASYQPVTEELHREFWSLFSEEKRQVWVAAEKAHTPKADLVLLKERLDVPFRQSLYFSVEAGQVVKAPDLEPLRTKTLSLVESTTDRKKLIDIFQRQDRWLDPQLSDHSRMVWHGDPIRVFEQWNKARVRLEQSRLLLTSFWNPELRAWPYPPLHLTLTWAYPWTLNSAMLCNSPCKGWSLGHFIDSESGGGIYYFGSMTSVNALLKYPDVRAGMNLMTDLMSTYKLIDQSREDGTWQGYRSTAFRSSIKVADGEYSYRVVRILFREQFEDALLIVGASSRSMSHAESAIARFEQAIHLD